MHLLTIDQISKAFGPVIVLDAVSFGVNVGERIGLVGANGAGKSTLLRIITGEIRPDDGRVTFAHHVRIGYLPQEPPPQATDHTIDELIREAVGGLSALEQRLRQLEAEMATAQGATLDAILAEYGEATEAFERGGGFDLDHRIDEVLSGLGLAHLPRQRRVGTLSGGERVRVMLASLLLQAPDLLLLDEPTNHLDFASAAWLEDYLASQRGAFIAVSHDRRFLNRTVTKIIEIDAHSHQTAEYIGSYDAYRAAKQRALERWKEDYERQQEEIRALRSAIRSTARHVAHGRGPTDNDKFSQHFFGNRVERAISRNVRNAEERLRRIETDPVPKPPRDLHINPDLNPAELRSDYAIRVEGVTKAYGQRCVLDGITFDLDSRARVVVLGENGAGKSTLLDIIAGRTAPDSGTVRLARGASIGYLDQDARSLDPTRSLLESYLEGLDGTRDELTNVLFHYGLFRADDLSKRVHQLSLGERRKLQLAKLMATRANVLLLDEPTNHLSLDLLEAFETALAEFPGVILAVSHDRWFIERFQGQAWELTNGRLLQHLDEPAAVLESVLTRR